MSAKVWRSPTYGSAEFLRGAFVDYSYDPHTHEMDCFALITEGAIRIKVRGDEFTARRGDLFAMEADGVHAGWPIDAHGWKLRTLYVNHDQLGAALGGDDALARPRRLASPLIRDKTLAAMFSRMHRRSETNAPPLACEEQYLKFVARLFERHVRDRPRQPAAGREDHAVELVREFLEHHACAQVSLSEIAAMAGLPPLRLLRSFARAVGMPPLTYQRQARVRRAAALIRGGRPLSEAAAASGFADQAHLTRSFRRVMGVTPGAYRAAFA